MTGADERMTKEGQEMNLAVPRTFNWTAVWQTEDIELNMPLNDLVGVS